MRYEVRVIIIIIIVIIITIIIRIIQQTNYSDRYNTVRSQPTIFETHS